MASMRSETRQGKHPLVTTAGVAIQLAPRPGYLEALGRAL